MLEPFDAPAQNTTILVTPSTAIHLPVTDDAAGTLSLPVDLTSDPSTVGLTVRTQAFELSGSTFTGLRASNALAATLCP